MKRFLMVFMLVVCMLLMSAAAETETAAPAQAVDLTALFAAIISLLCALITNRLIPWIKAKTTNEQQARLHAAINTVVYAAEQIYGAEKGNEKLAYAKSRLAEMGFNINSAEVITGIEAAVKAMQMI